MNLIFEHNIYLYLAIIFNLYVFFNSSLDWDTSNHLYDAKLRKKKINFKSSYRLGIKIFYIKIYQVFWNFLNKNLKFFRILNFIIFCITFLIFLNFTTENSHEHIILLIYFFFISFYNPQTSSTEFFSTLMVILIFNSLMGNIEFFLLGIFLILISSFLFKIIDILYLIPFILFNVPEINLDLSILIIILSLVLFLLILFFILFFQKKYFDILINYFFNRSFIKSRNFILKNIYIVIPIFYWTIDLLLFVNNDYRILIFTYLIIFFLQRGMTSYFYYPIFVLNFFISLKIDYFYFNEIMFNILVYSLFICFILSLILNLIFRDYEITYRILNNWNIFIWQDKYDEKRLIEFFNNNINKKYYFWGSRINIPLQIESQQLFENYYSHNHLILWDPKRIEKKYEEVHKFFYLKKPEYIIESGSLLNFQIKEEILQKYKLIFSNKVGKIYEKI